MSVQYERVGTCIIDGRGTVNESHPGRYRVEMMYNVSSFHPAHRASLNTRSTRKVLSAERPPPELEFPDSFARKLGGDRISSTRLLITINPSNRLNLSSA